jgi:hypothetical protein
MVSRGVCLRERKLTQIASSTVSRQVRSLAQCYGASCLRCGSRVHWACASLSDNDDMTNVHWCCPDCEELLVAEDSDGAYSTCTISPRVFTKLQSRMPMRSRSRSRSRSKCFRLTFASADRSRVPGSLSRVALAETTERCLRPDCILRYVSGGKDGCLYEYSTSSAKDS